MSGLCGALEVPFSYSILYVCIGVCLYSSFNNCVRISPVSDSVLQLGEDSAVQGVNVRQLVENLSKPLFLQHRFPLVPNGCPHRFPKVLAHRAEKLGFIIFVKHLTKLKFSPKSVFSSLLLQ